MVKSVELVNSEIVWSGLSPGELVSGFAGFVCVCILIQLENSL